MGGGRDLGKKGVGGLEKQGIRKGTVQEIVEQKSNGERKPEK